MGAVSGQRLVPLGFEAGATINGLTELVIGFLRHFEGAVFPTQLLARQSGFVITKGCTVHASGIALVGRAIADGGGHLDDRRLVRNGLGGFDRLGDGVDVGVAISHVLHVPAVGLIAFEDVFGEGNVGPPVDGDVVVVVQGDQLAQLEVTGQGGGFGGHTLLVAAVTHDHVGVVINEGRTRLVELGGQVGFGDRQADGVGDTGPQGARGHFNTGSFEGLRMTRGL